MTIRPLPLEQWRSYLDDLSVSMKGHLVEIEISGFDIGDQIKADWQRLEGITYDAADDALAVAVEGLVHVLKRPQAMAIDAEAGRVRCVAATDPQGRTHEIHFRQPIAEITG